jgi:hypothetical protein
MPPKAGGGGAGPKRRDLSLDNSLRRQTTSYNGPRGIGNPLAGNLNQSKFSIAPLLLEGLKVNKLQLNDIVKQCTSDIKLNDIQLSRAGIFTMYAADVKSFNYLLNDFPAVLSAQGHTSAKLFVPRSIQRIKDTEKVAFVKRVDVEIPEERISEALKHAGLDVTNVSRLCSREGNTPTRTIKITFSDVTNRNTFVYTGLQVDWMHFTAEAATQNTKPVQCYICLKYNHVAKYCQTKQQICARCGENHRVDQCNAANDVVKCSNCKGNHSATSHDCANYRELEKKMQNQIKQYSTNSKPAASVPALYSASDFPPLPNITQQQQDQIQKNIVEEILNVLSKKMEKIIEDTTTKLFQTLQKKIEEIEKTLTAIRNVTEENEMTTDSDSEEESQVEKYTNEKKKQNAEANKPTTRSATTKSATSTTTTASATKQTAKKTKRALSPNSSLDASTLDSNKDPKTNKNND